MRILSILGTRPEAIKMCPVVRAVSDHPEWESIVCVTAQHRQMLDQVLDIFNVVPHYDLNVMQPGQSLPDLTARLLKKLPSVLKDARPDRVLVHGHNDNYGSDAGCLLPENPCWAC